MHIAAVIGGSAVVAAGAVAMAISGEHGATTTFTSAEMTVGATTTQATPPNAPDTSLAVPVVKATPFGGAAS